MFRIKYLDEGAEPGRGLGVTVQLSVADMRMFNVAFAQTGSDPGGQTGSTVACRVKSNISYKAANHGLIFFVLKPIR